MGRGLQIEVEWGNDEEKKGEISLVSSSETNNISQNNVGVVGEPKKPFLIGTSKFSDNCYFMNSYIGFISRTSSDENGMIDFTITINCTNVLSLIMKFDDDVFPTSIEVGSNTYANDSNVFFMAFSSVKNGNVDVRFTKMNKANKPLIIKFITPSLTRKYDSGQISNLTIGNSISSENGLSYGITGKYGSFTLHDKRHEVYSILKNADFYNFKTRVYFDDKILGTFKIQEITSSESDYNYNITLKDLTDDFENYNVYPFFYDNGLYSLNDFFTKIQENTDNVFLKNCKFNLTNIENYKDLSLSNFMSDTTMPIIFNTEKKSVTQMLNEFCKLIQCNMFVSENGEDLEVVNFG